MKRTNCSIIAGSLIENERTSQDNCDQFLKAPGADGVQNRYKFSETRRILIAKRKDKRIAAKHEPTILQLLDTMLSSDLSCRTFKDLDQLLKTLFLR
jgi:hypothetical protein